ncbi:MULTISPECIES: hypothetical protein [Idiomarina]|uniref:hypothetical protein n=1 Tax=Idiomarina TaxID=135575 RepID=UPI00241CA5F4|nr:MULTISPECIES: hypothetical protein [Idiomarina]|tara:strand:- start:19368 stop:19523 length:156 start_codon:yes stop_codon:yes gene_type:complete
MSKKEEEVLRGDKDLERERKANDPMIPDGEVNPINTDYQVGQDNVVMKVGL